MILPLPIMGICIRGLFFTGEIYERPFWYSYEEDRILGFDYFMSLFAQGVKPSFTFAYEEKTKVTPCAISADGTFIMGNNDVVVAMGGVPECWMLQTEYRTVKIPATPEGLQAKSQEFKEVTLTWNKDEQVYDGLELESYNVYCGGEKIDNVAADVLELTYRHRNATPGFPEYSIASVFQAADASKVESPKSNPVAVAVPDTYELPFFDDFDSQFVCHIIKIQINAFSFRRNIIFSQLLYDLRHGKTVFLIRLRQHDLYKII